jgi:hypothetical protein
MPSRPVEKFEVRSFRVGEAYSREQIAEMARVAPLVNSREWTGIVDFSNCTVLFSTLDKSNLPAGTAPRGAAKAVAKSSLIDRTY